MLHRVSKFITVSGMAAALAVGAIPKPATASTQSAMNTAIAAAAVIGGLILYNNYQHKRQAANAVVGYTRNGGTVYGDGRIVMPNGQTIYPNSNGTYSWGQTAYYNPNASGYTYDTQRSGQYDVTRRHGHSSGNAYGNGNDMRGEARSHDRGKHDRGNHPDQHDNHDNH
jgi:hypothetical protein